jgi:hypothetical protein
VNITAVKLTRQALSCLDQAGFGSSPAACHLQSALAALGGEVSVQELEELAIALFASTSVA